MPIARPRRNTVRTAASTLGALSLLVALSACMDSATDTVPASTVAPPSATTAAAEARINIKGFSFIPQDLTVRPGAKINVINSNSVPHTVTATDGAAFDTGQIAPGQSVTFTAPDTPGSYAFICSLHPRMKGTLTVA
ncbi:cupredoxin domain-containing protein [Streptomyces katrae]|uniref:Cupredoxin domain-containing protein n=1 Tax=Streptomyces katrae TaxID=68223 RepID=A0ABT7H4V6_9ACTN|nr:cupredoxin domain-containing protein [Streptomyces katrae]MDK9500930.1 cupredoxin domain-containing protein [Streptomyces katrae]